MMMICRDAIPCVYKRRGNRDGEEVSVADIIFFLQKKAFDRSLSKVATLRERFLSKGKIMRSTPRVRGEVYRVVASDLSQGSVFR
ncbi:MAG: hypothetical protein RL023_248 [Candidatus Parcubacteria bacterium]|jgi:predicted transcriptional regulator